MTDEEIIAGLLARNHRVLEALEQRYQGYCAAIASGLLADSGEVEQILNDTWMQVWTSIPPNQPVHLRLYVGRITRNLALNRLDYLNAQKRAVPLEELCAVAQDLYLERRVLQDALERFLRRQKPEHRRIFLRRYWYGDSVEEIASALGCSRVRISGILFRLRNKLRKDLEQEELI